jgi:hypothetical protein
LYSSPNIIKMVESRRMKLAGHVKWLQLKRDLCKLLVGKPEGQRPLGRLRHSLVNNIYKVIIKEMMVYDTLFLRSS